LIDNNRRKQDPYKTGTSAGTFDRPTNFGNNRLFSARLFLVEETADKTIRIWQGITWGYESSEKVKKE